MYLSHFGFSRQPFNNVTATDSFYGGANRGATLDALVYVLTHGEGVEGIIEVTGETGSGKTTLCRLLMRRLPANLKTIYLARPNLSREELFQSIADELKFKLTEGCIIAASSIVVSELQGALIERHAAGRQVVLLLDEAHTLPAETLEALRLLYELESSRHKLLQIVLFGESELKTTLARPQMRQFRDRVTHHFVTQPFNAKAAKEYLILRMRAAGYHGPCIFAPDAISLIAAASGGLVSQINLLADKSLQAAFAVHAHDIRIQHVRAVIRDSEDSGIRRRAYWWDGSNLLNHRGAGAGAVLALVVLSALVWDALRPEPTNAIPAVASVPVEGMKSTPVSPPLYSATVESVAPNSSPPASASAPGYTAPPVSSAPPVSPVSSVPSQAGAGNIASAQGGLAATTEQQNTAKLGIGGAKLTGYGLLEQRVEATKKIMATTDKNYYSIQLFATENIQPDRMERFLSRAQNIVNLSDLYMHPVTNEGQAKFRVTYGIYPSREQASAALDELPQKYKTSFHPELYTLSELR